ncbi:MAG: hypothetical protein SFU85_13415 [Candidatus Methylacidiphilales bacterium]|nr:hypothetical protein [Candidatus Methylacidiphilales bacterium]
MSITVVKEGGVLRVIDSSEPIPEGAHLELYTENELLSISLERKAMLDLQMPSFIRGDEDESAEELFEIPGK